MNAPDEQSAALTIPAAPSDHPARVFLVGCPRSGTTLLRALLSAHPGVASFPETHFFAQVARARTWRRGGWRRRLGIPLPDARASVDRLVSLGILERDRARDRPDPATVREYAELLTAALDEVAVGSGASHWVEKTPGHLHYLREIELYVTDSKIVHMIRSGQAVVASLHDARRSRPDIWGRPTTVSELIGIWRGDLRRSRACVGRPNHAFVSYERLVADPEAVLGRLCSFLELPVDDAGVRRMVSDYQSAGMEASGSVRDFAPWDKGVEGPLQNRNRDKFDALFSVSERAEVDRAVAEETRTLEAFPFL